MDRTRLMNVQKYLQKVFWQEIRKQRNTAEDWRHTEEDHAANAPVTE